MANYTNFTKIYKNDIMRQIISECLIKISKLGNWESDVTKYWIVFVLKFDMIELADRLCLRIEIWENIFIIKLIIHYKLYFHVK